MKYYISYNWSSGTYSGSADSFTKHDMSTEAGINNFCDDIKKEYYYEHIVIILIQKLKEIWKGFKCKTCRRCHATEIIYPYCDYFHKRLYTKDEMKNFSWGNVGIQFKTDCKEWESKNENH